MCVSICLDRPGTTTNRLADRQKAGRKGRGRWLSACLGGGGWGTYIESPHDPRAGSYKPPRTGFSSVSKVVSFSIFLTDTA